MRDLVSRYRIAIGLVLIVVVAGLTSWYVITTARPEAGAGGQNGGVLVIDQRAGGDAVSTLDGDPEGQRTPTGLRCQRVYSAGGTTVCLRPSGVGFEAAVLDAGGKTLRSVALPGVPSRARVSASGRIVSWTVFVTGDSYAAPGGFSTRTGFLDLRSGTLVESLESFSTTVDGAPHDAVDENFWGLTVAADDTTFYATLGTGGRRWLVKGDLSARTVATVRPGPECPSLSPDGTKVAYKKAGRWVGRWELAVLDLAAGKETVLPKTEGIDDQAAWLDDSTLAYGAPSSSTGVPSVFRVAADGSSDPVLLAKDASSPVPAG
ncbi:hypothetical protein SAMN05192558_10698 [Actinokineospora alba]|uniref:WD40-like Beta Propeller Repeat n=1 Tax=Actinokineospora alba TaxID=504798 RepID=A0A1H0PFL5_9PSEU|nr:hypothetical protein [Actinokineospora alba]TDP65777.1 hypothetical protein C8E96_1265 [Actinokineospora alba]SDI65342.1 hypothetical protein SAMN05421871_106354 [Actinokineospora alba]SDP03821.1 hypothetical protein SAMN05192558_10698 [Actinokineospora alba]